MNKVINGKMYDTETADMMGMQQIDLTEFDEDDEGVECKTALIFTQKLYRKRSTGEFFFLVNDPESVYRKNKIEPCTDKEAMSWAEKCLTGYEYEMIFGVVEE